MALAADRGVLPPAGSTIDDRAQAISCMASAILYESASEPLEGQEAVAEVILNRLRNPAFPKTVCGVVFQGSERRTGCQFSFTCDGSLAKVLPADIVMRVRELAARAIDGRLEARTAGATHYHADYVSPYWAPSLVRVGTIGRHIFYRQPGASAISTLALYQGVGEHMPAVLAGAEGSTLGATPQPTSGEKREKPERFMPWGLPVANVQAVASPK